MRIILVVFCTFFFIIFCKGQYITKLKNNNCETLLNFIKSDSIVKTEKNRIIFHYVKYFKDTLQHINFNESCLVGMKSAEIIAKLGPPMIDYSDFAYRNNKKDTVHYDFAYYYIILNKNESTYGVFGSSSYKRLVFKFKNEKVYEVSYRISRTKIRNDYKILKPKWSK